MDPKYNIHVGGDVSGPVVVGNNNVQHNDFGRGPAERRLTMALLQFCPMDGSKVRLGTGIYNCEEGHVFSPSPTGEVLWERRK